MQVDEGQHLHYLKCPCLALLCLTSHVLSLPEASDFMSDCVLAHTAATRAMNIAADICIYTNHNFTKEVLDYRSEPKPESLAKEP